MRAHFRFGFVIENYIGHANFARMLRDAVDDDPAVEGVFALIAPGPETLLDHVPVVGTNMTMRVSARAHSAVHDMVGHVDAVLVHTQTAALFLPRLAKRVPVVISTDGTPANIDEVGAFARVDAGSRAARVKNQLTARSLRNTSHFIAWTDWVASSLINDYSVPEHQVTVLSPGVGIPNLEDRATSRAEDRLNVLFVGGDLERKGGAVLVAALEGLGVDWHLDLVTKSPWAASDRVTVHRDLSPGDARLAALFQRADVFALPTSADTYGFAVLEAMAFGLPVVTTRVGGLAARLEAAGAAVMVDVGGVEGLRAALARLVASPDLKGQLAQRARALAEREFDSRVNLPRMLDVLKNHSRLAGDRTHD